MIIRQLREYESTAEDLPISAATADAIRQVAGTRLNVDLSEATDGYRATATSYVGTLSVEDVRLLIRPKVDLRNVFYLLESGGSPVSVDPDLFDYEAAELVPAFATFFARVAERTLAQGVVRDYIEIEDRVPAIRGRIDLRSQHRMAGVLTPVACLFDEYAADTALNRLVRGSVSVLTGLPGLTVNTRRALAVVDLALTEVGRVHPRDLANPTLFTRLTDHYRALERLSRLVLEGSAIADRLPESDDRGAQAGTFLIDMAKVFEQFVEARLRSLLGGHLDVVGQSTRSFDKAGEARIRPDLLFEVGGQPMYVGDSKYKLIAADGFGRESDYYQLLAYVTVFGLDEGVLVYCQNDGQKPSKVLEIENAGARLRTYSVTLSGSIADIDREMAELAQNILRWAGRRSAVA